MEMRRTSASAHATTLPEAQAALEVAVLLVKSVD